MVLGKLPVPESSTNLDEVGLGSTAIAVNACGLFGHFFLSSIISLFPPFLWETARYRMKYYHKQPLSPKHTSNQQFLGGLPPMWLTSTKCAYFRL